MKKQILFFLVAFLSASWANAQSQLTIKDITHHVFTPESIQGMVPMNDGEHYLQLNKEQTKVQKYAYKKNGVVATLFDVSTVRGDKLNEIDGFILSPDESRLLIQTKTNRIYRRSFTAEYYIFSIRNNKMAPLSKKGAQQVPQFSPDGQQIAFVRNNNIHLVKLLFNNSESQVTKDGKRNAIINGIPDWVNEEEFAYNCAYAFSPDSKMIAYVRFDESQVPLFSFMQYAGLRPQKSEFAEIPGTYAYKYPKTGMKNAVVSVHAYDIKSHVTRQMKLPIQHDDYVPRIQFTGTDNSLAIVSLNRTQNKMDIYLANPRSRECRLILRNEDRCYVKETAYDNLTFYQDRFVLLSEKDGFNHLYVYGLDGLLKQQLTQGNYEVKTFLGWDKATNTYYYTSNEEGPEKTALYKIRKGKKTKLSSRVGTNTAQFSATYKYYVNRFTSFEVPMVITVCNNKGKTLHTLLSNQELASLVQRMDLPRKELFSFTTSKGLRLNGWMMKPAHFDAHQKYPVLFYQYSGPGSQQVVDEFKISWETYMATQGYLIVCVDGRGTGGRGADFEKCTYMNIGVKEAEDQIAAAQYMATLPYADAKRMAIWGWSYGGYNTLMAMCEGSGIFKAGIAVAPVTDWKYYDTIYGERFMRTPKENAEGYAASSVFTRAHQLKGALLIVHGSADDNVHVQNTMEFTEKLVQLGLPFDMQIYTNRNHSIYGGNTRTHLFQRLTRFLKEHL
jgi:dipeptidyl-peptidase-4